MIPGYGETPANILTTVSELMSGLTGTLEVTSGELLGMVPEHKLKAHFDLLVGEKPKSNTFELALEQIATPTTKLPGAAGALDLSSTFKAIGFGARVFANSMASGDYKARRKNLQAALNAFVIRRQVAQLSDRERALMSAFAAMYADGGLTLVQWHKFYALMAWASGRCDTLTPAAMSRNPHVSEARKMLVTLLMGELPDHDSNLAAATNALASYRAKSAAMAERISAALSRGARWFQPGDLASSRSYAVEPSAPSLLLGYGQGSQPLYFNGNESLITFGAPGTGKTQGQVIPNLLRYPGSAFVLDVKGELWEKTAEHRRRSFGPVYRFAPTLAEGSANYNPFDCIGIDPAEAANDAQVFVSELIPDNPSTRDPYWERKARDILWAFVTLVAISAPPEKRNLAEVSRYLSMQVNFDTDAARYKASTTKVVVQSLKVLARATGLQDLESAATTIESGISSTRLESVFDTARSFLNTITRSATASKVMSSSDWHPLELRRTPGTTIYLTLKPGELRGFAPLVRVIFQQHVTALTKDFTRRPGEPPVTFFLDEMPQLGAMAGLSDIIDVGRGAGIRLWMFAQYLGQIRALYHQRADGLINACAVRCFMQPDLDAAQFIAPQLGHTSNVITGASQELAPVHDLMGRAFADSIVTLARGEHPANLSKQMAYIERNAARLIA